MDFFNVMPYFLLLVSMAFLSMALFVFLRRKPLILNSIWILIITILCFLGPMLMSAQTTFKHPSFIGFLPILMYSVLIVMLIVTMKGFMIYGVDGTDFQRLFIECLKDKNYEYEQTLSSIKIKDPELELSIAIQSWVGTVQVKSKGNHEVLNAIINQLKTKEIKANFIFPIFYLLTGILLTILSISMIIKSIDYANTIITVIKDLVD
jgi:hypothetical protein